MNILFLGDLVGESSLYFLKKKFVPFFPNLIFLSSKLMKKWGEKTSISNNK